MKRIVYLLVFVFSCFVLNSYVVFSKSKIKNKHYVLSDDYIRKIDNFIHIKSSCKACMVPRSANAGCVVTKDEKILLVRDKYTKKLGLPGGMRKKHEIAAATAVRETLEETGLIVYIDDFISEFKNGFRLYKCKVIADKKETDGEIYEFRYVNKRELKDLLKKENRKDVRFPYELDLIYSKFESIVK